MILAFGKWRLTVKRVATPASSQSQKAYICSGTNSSNSDQRETLWRAFSFFVFQWVGSEILHGLSRHSHGVSSSRFLLGSSLSLLGGSCHACIMPQVPLPHLLDCVKPEPHIPITRLRWTWPHLKAFRGLGPDCNLGRQRAVRPVALFQFVKCGVCAALNVRLCFCG